MATAIHARRPSVRLRLPGAVRKIVLLVHIVTAVGWLGIDLVMGVLILTALPADDPYRKMINYGALSFALFWPMITVAVMSLVSGLLLGWSSKYGVVRSSWVLIKLILNVLLAALVIIALNPTLITAGEVSRQLFAGGVPDESELQSLIFPPIVSTSALIFACYLAVFKPRGRRRNGRT